MIVTVTIYFLSTLFQDIWSTSQHNCYQYQYGPGYIIPFMVCTFHTRVSGLNRDKHTLQYTWQTRDAVQQPRISSSLYSTVQVNEKQQEQNYLMEFHSRHPNSHGFVGVSCEYTKIDSRYHQPLRTILYYNGKHYNGTLRCIACVGSYAEHCFVQWPVACLAPSHFSKTCWLFLPIVIKFTELSGPMDGIEKLQLKSLFLAFAEICTKGRSTDTFVHGHSTTLESQKKRLSVISIIET